MDTVLQAFQIVATPQVLEVMLLSGLFDMFMSAVQGLTAPLLAAGARAVVATAWPIDDHETVAVVEDFYRALSRGATVGSALREAKLAAMRRGAPARDWASFTVIGDPTVRIPLESPSRARWWIVAALVIVTLGVVAATRWWPRSWHGD